MSAPSFRDFREELLIQIAFKTEGNPSTLVDPSECADEAGLQYRPGWVRQAAKYWDGSGALRIFETMGGGDDGGISMMTAPGLADAESLANERGFDLYEEMEERRETPAPKARRPVTAAAPASDRVVRIDHNSATTTDIQEKLAEVVTWFEHDNSLSREGDARDQRLAELRAGQLIVDAPQANTAVLDWLVLKPLKWLGERVADHAVGAVIAALVTAVGVWLGLG